MEAGRDRNKGKVPICMSDIHRHDGCHVGRIVSFVMFLHRIQKEPISSQKRGEGGGGLSKLIVQKVVLSIFREELVKLSA